MAVSRQPSTNRDSGNQEDEEGKKHASKILNI